MGPPTGRFQIPDWRDYKVAGCKELEQLERMLAAKGLKDPWIRNEVWRYQKSNNAGVAMTMFRSVFRGLKFAVLAVGAGIFLENIVSKHLVLREESEKCIDEPECQEPVCKE